MTTAPVDFKTPLKTLDQAKAFIQSLYDNDQLFHFEDSPENIGNTVNGEWVSTFTKAEAKLARLRVAEMYGMEWGPELDCPIGYALVVLGE